MSTNTKNNRLKIFQKIYFKIKKLNYLTYSLVSFFFFHSPLLAFIPEYTEEWENKDKSFNLIKDHLYGQGDYLHPNFLKFIDKNQVHFILEIGSRDAIDALDLSQFYQSHVCAFECNPQ